MMDNKSKFNFKEYQKSYQNKRYNTDKEYRRKKSSHARSRYVRKTIDCSKCGIRVKIEKVKEDHCPTCYKIIQTE